MDLPHKWLTRSVIGIVLVAILGFSAYRLYQQHKSAVTAAAVTTKSLHQGSVLDHVPLIAPADGIVTEILVADGEQVQAGQVLVCVENSDLRSQYQTVLAEYARLKAAADAATKTPAVPQMIPEGPLMIPEGPPLTAGSVQMIPEGPPPIAKSVAVKPAGTAKANFERMEKLYAIGGVSRKQYEQAKAAYESEQQAAAPALPPPVSRPGGTVVIGGGAGAVNGELSAVQERLKNLEAQMMKSQVRAEKAGVIAAINCHAGDKVSAGTPLLYMADFSLWPSNTTAEDPFWSNGVNRGFDIAR